MSSICTPVARSLLESRISTMWPEFKAVSFGIFLNDTELTADEVVLYDGASLQVVNHCKEFARYDEEDVLNYAGVTDVVVNDDVFHTSVAVREGDISCTKEELTRRLAVCDIYQQGELTMREFITPVLVNALVAAPHVKLVAAKMVTGRKARGSVDYMLTYRDFPMCVTVCRREAIDRSVIQNIAQLIASREAFCHRNKCVKEDLEDVPSSGIVSTGEDWIFVRYLKQSTEYLLFRSKAFKLTLDEHRPLSRDQVGMVLARVVGMVEFQIAAIDSSVKLPRRPLIPQLSSKHAAAEDQMNFDVE